MVFYEAPHKLTGTLNDMLAAFGDRRITISRELTKLYEETIRCTLSEAISHFEQTIPRGEFVLVIEGALDNSISDAEFSQARTTAHLYIDGGLSVKDAVKKAAGETGVSKNILYNEVIKSSNK